MNNYKLFQSQAMGQLLQYCHVRIYPSKKRVCRVGDPNTTLFIILDGTVSVGVEDYETGHGVVYGYLREGDCIGAISVFHTFNSSLTQPLQVDAITLSTCKLAEITYAHLWQLMRRELATYALDILVYIGQQVAARLQTTEREVQVLVTMDAEERIYQTLLLLSNEPDSIKLFEGTQINVTRQELSRIAGCSYEVAGRMLKKLENKNKIKLNGKKKSILILKE